MLKLIAIVNDFYDTIVTLLVIYLIRDLMNSYGYGYFSHFVFFDGAMIERLDYLFYTIYNLDYKCIFNTIL